LSSRISAATFPSIKVELLHPSGPSSVVETTYFRIAFICAAIGFCLGSCFGQNAAHSV